MAKVKTMGQAIVVVSEVKLEDIKKIQKYRPEALVLKGGEDNKEEIFRIGIGDGKINTYGASFCEETRDDEKLATITMTTNYNGDDIKGFIADELGGALTNLGKLEKTLPAVLDSIDKERTAIMEGITIASFRQLWLPLNCGSRFSKQNMVQVHSF